MDLLFALIQLARDWIQNMGILVMLLLLYNFIPNRIFHRKGWDYSILVGLIFGLAAMMGILVPWSGTSHPSIGFNGILVPLAAYTGGLISGGITTIFLLVFRFFVEGSIGPVTDLAAVFLAFGTGSAVHAYLKRYRSASRVHALLALSLLFASFSVFILSLQPTEISGEPAISPGFWLIFPWEIGGIIFAGLFLLGMVIIQINRKKEGECELVRYQNELKELVRERTAELAEVNSLQQATLESTSDGIVVVDLKGMVTGYNRTAESILDIRPSLEVREESLDVFHLLRYHLADPDLIDQGFLDVSPDKNQILLSELYFQSGSSYEFAITPYLLGGEMLGKVLTFRDITEKKKAEEELKAMNQKLLMLAGITRHDILNQIAALNLYVYLLKTDLSDPQTPEYLERMGQTLRLMQEHTRESGDYQNVGIHEPVWQDPSTVFTRVTASFSGTGIDFSSDLSRYEILADPLIDRALYNLVDNSVRHGNRVSVIHLTGSQAGDQLDLIYEDNGSGVQHDEKERIFEEGFGKHTGFGMFLVREILAVTGISISETGTFGNGARFEMKVPPGAFRKKGEIFGDAD